MNKAQVAKELKAYIEALADSWPEGDTNVIDKMATAIETAIPLDTKNEFAIKARENAQRARKFGISEKGVIYIVEAQCAYKDYMLFKDAVKGELFPPGKPKGSLSTKTIYINQLVSTHHGLCPKELYRIADKSILGKGKPMKISTFDKKVSEARNPK